MKKMTWLFLSVILLLAGCDKRKMVTYYEEKSNYIPVEGIVCHLKYNDDSSELYIALSQMEPVLDDISFKLVGKNTILARQQGIDNLLQLGDFVRLVTAPRYFGDGYVMPIVEIENENAVFLTFDEGYANFLDWLKE